MQKVLTMTTSGGTLRSKVISWGHEDGDAVGKSFRERLGTEHQYSHANLMPVGLIGGSIDCPAYATVLHALGDGWKLLSTPSETEYRINNEISWSWWLVRDS